MRYAIYLIVELRCVMSLICHLQLKNAVALPFFVIFSCHIQQSKLLLQKIKLNTVNRQHILVDFS